MKWQLRFLGVGNSQSAPLLGSASAVLERNGVPQLLIDCGQETLTAYLACYGQAPQAIFITHLHLDHVGGLERLFYTAYFDDALRGKIKLLVPASIVPAMQSRLADYPGVLAEGGANWWDAFQLIPVSASFWHAGLHFSVFPVRHHLPDSAFGLRLPGSFIWTGDTRPIPERLSDGVQAGELIAHDCGLVGNPSHTGLADIQREYPASWWPLLVLYHYASSVDSELMQAQGFRVAVAGQAFDLSAPEPGPLA
ncbi:MBL fold metallo-hydrolase [Arenimonas sp.]|jgi:phosphoribosyl 1,2-cyclic phosphodiesterase|uniref:MBL fold metallo-hydrolase n=1 Tax=Arenimonas sp. TaxID=1872635 RepID=UPI0037C099C9